MTKIIKTVKKLSKKEAKQFQPFDVLYKGLEEPLKIQDKRLRQKFCELKELVEKVNLLCTVTATVAVCGRGFRIVIHYNDTGATFVYSIDEAIDEMLRKYKMLYEWDSFPR
jgi:hypothetical protein